MKTIKNITVLEIIRKIRVCSILCCLFFFPAISYAEKVELLQNGDFGDGGMGWSVYRQSSIAGTVNYQYTNNELAVTLQQQLNPQDVQLIQQITALSGGEQLTLTFEAKSTLEGTIFVQLSQSSSPFK